MEEEEAVASRVFILEGQEGQWPWEGKAVSPRGSPWFEVAH